MNYQNSNWKHTYTIIAILFLAFLLRFINLGIQPLSDAEANLALQALSSAKGVSILWSGEPAYLAFTSLLFSLFDQTNFSARLFPALFGTLIVGLPLFSKRYLAKPAAILLAVLLTLDPALISLSRTAGGATSTLFFLGAAIVFFGNNSIKPTGVFFGLALLGGVWLWHILFPILIAVLLWKLLDNKHQDLNPTFSLPIKSVFMDRSIWMGFILSVILLGTLWFIYPNALSSIAGSFTDYLDGWKSQSSLSFPIFWLGVLIYFPLGAVFGIWGGIRRLLAKDGMGIFLCLWLISALFVNLVHPGRELTFLLSCILPLYILASEEVSRYLHAEEGEILPSLGVASLFIVIISFLMLNVAKLTFGGDQKQLIIALGGSIGILIISGVLIFLGWSGDIARKGYIWGLLGILMVTTFSTAWRTADPGGNSSAEMIGSSTSQPQLNLMMNTIREVSNWNIGSSNGIDISVVDIDSKSLEWGLRDFPNTNFHFGIDKGDYPSIIISSPDKSFEFQDQYRGQDFVMSKKVQMESFDTFDWISWLVQRKADYEPNNVVLWVRAELFSDSQSIPVSP